MVLNFQTFENLNAISLLPLPFAKKNVLISLHKYY